LALPVLIFGFEVNRQTYEGVLFILTVLLPALTSIFTIIVGANMFSVFQNKRSMDLYGSFPVKRTTLFLSKYVAGIILLMVPLFVFGLLGGIAPYMSRVSVETYNVVALVMSRCITIGVGVIASYTMFAFLSLCCGTTANTIISYAAINILYPFMLFMITFVFGICVPGFSHTLLNITPGYDMYTGELMFEPISGLVDCLCSPILGTFIGGDVVLFNMGESETLGVNISAAKYLVYWLIFIGVVFVASLFIAKRRKNENVQNGFVYTLPKIIVTILATIAMGLLAGFLFVFAFAGNIGKSETAYVLYYLFGAFTGGLLAFTVLTLLYNRGINNFVKSLPVLAGSYAIVLVGGFVIATGVFGTDTYVPKPEKIESVIVTSDITREFSMINDIYDSSIYDVNFDNNDKEEYAIKNHNWYINKEGVITPADFRITDENIIKDTVEMHKYIVDNMHKYYGNLYGATGAADFDYEPDYNKTPYELQIIYKMKDGSIVKRTYDNGGYDVDKVRELYNKIASSEIYKKQYLPINLCDLNRAYKVEISGGMDGRDPWFSENGEPSITNAEKTAAATELLVALRKDIMADENFVDTCDIKDSVNGTDYEKWIYGDEMKIQISYNNDLYSQKYNQHIHGLACEEYIIPKDKYKNVWSVLEKYSDDELNFEGKKVLILM
ncbi:MAG: ABC transporter permease, partial [Acutalibacteraceae bacterium]|nr:ABC transporter permease [Acutalibacteraceae bacterium]